jgi:[protein-PII] uridylyltransferase
MDAAERLRASLAELDRRPLRAAHGLALAAERSSVIDRALRALFPRDPGGRLALVALGGYGRRELAPGSDVDLLVLHEPGAEAEAGEAIAAVLYPLWDAGLDVGHALRTPEECRSQASLRFDALTPLLDARLLAGSASLLGLARGHVLAVARGVLPEEIRAHRVEREAAHGLLGETLEPDLREAVGGLRDLHAAGWLAATLPSAPGGRPDPAGATADPARAGEAAARFDRAGAGEAAAGFDPAGRLATLREAGLVGPRAERALLAAWSHLVLVRTALHRVSGRRSNRLAADHQADVATALDTPGRDGWEPADALMRGLFLHGRAVALHTEALLDQALAAAGPGPRARGAPGAAVAPDPEAPTDGDAAAALEPFVRLARAGGWIAASDLERLAAASPPGAWSPGALEAFVEILAAGEGGARALSTMDAVGLLGALVPEWDLVRGRPQRDPFHRFPVDTHLLRSTAEAARLLHRPGEPAATEAVGHVDDPAPLLLGALLHDVGKVGRGSHVSIGAGMAAAILERMGVPEPLRDTVAFLVREHLLLSDTATRRDLDDDGLVLHVAARIGDERRLALLYLLTLADAASTGPAAATPWRLGLVRELVMRVGAAFERGEMDPDRAGRLATARDRAAAALARAGYRGARIEAFLEGLPPGYLLWAEPEDAPHHLPLVLPSPGPNEVRTWARPGRADGTHLVAIGAGDRPGLLATVAGALTLSGLSVLTAQAFTTAGGVALDAFEVTAAFDPHVGEDRWRRLRRIVRHALEGRIDVGDRIEELRKHYPPARAVVPVRVRLDGAASGRYTVVEVGAPDRMGLLFDLARTFADAGLDVHLAKVATYGPRVIDAFYVADEAGRKLDDPDRQAGLERALRAAALR